MFMMYYITHLSLLYKIKNTSCFIQLTLNLAILPLSGHANLF